MIDQDSLQAATDTVQDAVSSVQAAANAFQWFKALHIIFIVTWFAGLFYIVRLFVYHTEASRKREPERSILLKQYRIMERRLWWGITWPSAIATMLFGPLTWIFSFDSYITQPYFILKLCFVFGLVLYHLKCHMIFEELKRDHYRHSSLMLRIWNEVASVILVAIVFLIVFKRNTALVGWSLAIVLLAASLYIGIQIYRKNRVKNKDDEDTDYIPVDNTLPPSQQQQYQQPNPNQQQQYQQSGQFSSGQQQGYQQPWQQNPTDPNNTGNPNNPPPAQ